MAPGQSDVSCTQYSQPEDGFVSVLQVCWQLSRKPHASLEALAEMQTVPVPLLLSRAYSAAQVPRLTPAPWTARLLRL
jgi:hypothetical protein